MPEDVDIRDRQDRQEVRRHLEFARIKYRKAMIAGIDGAQEANSRVIELLKVEKYNQVK